MSTQTDADAAPSAAPVPRDVRLISLILASMGIDDAEPAVLVQLMEFAQRTSVGLTPGYTSQILQDALVYADHAAARQGGNHVSIDDVQLAIQSRVNYSFTQPPPKEHCLTNVNFALVPDAPPASQFGDSMVQQSAPAPKDHRAASAEVMEDTSMDDAHVAGAKRTLDEDEDYD